MSIKRAPRKKSNFTILDNQMFSSGLSFRAIGLLSYLLSKPDHWQVSIEQLRKYAAETAKPDGRDSIYAMLNELIEKRYVSREARRDESGRMAGNDYVIHDCPLPESPLTDMPLTDSPLAAETTQVSTEVLGSTDNPASTEKPSPPDGDVIDVFEHWRAAMKKTKAVKLDAKRKGKIRARLKDGFTVDDIKKAIDGCASSAFHMGDNPNGRKHDDLELICRDGTKLESFMSMKAQAPRPTNKHRQLSQATADGMTADAQGGFRL